MLSMSQGCMDVSADDGVKVFGFIQPQWQYSFEETPTNSFMFNRARLGVTGAIPYDFKYYVVLEMSSFFTGNPYLLDAYISYNRFMWVQPAIGQFKSPFSLELQTPCHKLHTIYRSHFLVDLASPLRDLGFMVYGGNDTTLFKYQVAIMNGTGMNVLDNNAGKDYVGRLLIQPFNGALSFGGSARYGKSAPGASGVEEEDEHTRLGGEVRFHKWKFNIQGEFIWGKDVGSYTEGGGCGGPGEVKVGSKERLGYYGMAYYLFDFGLEPVFKFEYYNKNSATDVIDTQSIMTFGFSYFFNDWTRLQINYLYAAEQDVEIQNDQLVVQFQVVF